MALAEYGEELSDEMADELDSVEAGFEEAADEAGLTPEEVSEAQEALEAAARGEVPPAEMEEAMAALEAIASGEMTVAEAAAEEMALPLLGPLIGMAGSLFKSTIGPSLINGAAGFLGDLLGGGGEEATARDIASRGRTKPKLSLPRTGALPPRRTGYILPTLPTLPRLPKQPARGIKAGIYTITPVKSKLKGNPGGLYPRPKLGPSGRIYRISPLVKK